MRKKDTTLKKGDQLVPYDERKAIVEVVGFGRGRTKVKVRSQWTGKVRELDNDVAKLRRRFALPDRMRRSGSQRIRQRLA